jgi:hypothetical protein
MSVACFTAHTWEAKYLVAEALGGNDGNFIADTLVGLEIEGEPRIVSPGRGVVSILAAEN